MGDTLSFFLRPSIYLFFSLREESLGKRGASSGNEDEGKPGAPADDDYGGSTDEEQSQSPPRTQAQTAPLGGGVPYGKHALSLAD